MTELCRACHRPLHRDDERDSGIHVGCRDDRSELERLRDAVGAAAMSFDLDRQAARAVADSIFEAANHLATAHRTLCQVLRKDAA